MSYREPDVQIGPTVDITESNARVDEIRRLKTRHGPVPAAVAHRIADALFHAENGYYWHGIKRSAGRIALLVLVSDIVRAVEEGMGFTFVVWDGQDSSDSTTHCRISEGQNSNGAIRHCRNGQFLRALLESCQLDQRTRWRIPKQLAQLVDASRKYMLA